MAHACPRGALARLLEKKTDIKKMSNPMQWIVQWFLGCCSLVQWFSLLLSCCTEWVSSASHLDNWEPPSARAARGSAAGW